HPYPSAAPAQMTRRKESLARRFALRTAPFVSSCLSAFRFFTVPSLSSIPSVRPLQKHAAIEGPRGGVNQVRLLIARVNFGAGIHLIGEKRGIAQSVLVGVELRDQTHRETRRETHAEFAVVE